MTEKEFHEKYFYLEDLFNFAVEHKLEDCIDNIVTLNDNHSNTDEKFYFLNDDKTLSYISDNDVCIIEAKIIVQAKKLKLIED